MSVHVNNWENWQNNKYGMITQPLIFPAGCNLFRDHIWKLFWQAEELKCVDTIRQIFKIIVGLDGISLSIFSVFLLSRYTLLLPLWNSVFYQDHQSFYLVISPQSPWFLIPCLPTAGKLSIQLSFYLSPANLPHFCLVMRVLHCMEMHGVKFCFPCNQGQNIQIATKELPQ